MKKKTSSVSYWLSFFFLTCLTLLIFSTFSPDLMVLGNAVLPFYAVLVISASLIILVNYLFTAIYKYIGKKVKEDKEWFGVTAILNIGAIWIISKGAAVIGLGIATLFVAVASGLIITFLVYLIKKYFRF